jgi:hypothetical protein
MLVYSSARYAESEPLLRRALAIDEASCGPDAPRIDPTMHLPLDLRCVL